MKTSLSIAHVLSDLEAQLAHHEGQEAFHAQQEAFHREQRILHAEGLGKVRERYEAFKAGVAAAGEIFAGLPQAAPAPPAPILSEGDGRRSTVAKLVLRLVAAKAGNETFTPSSVAAELNERFPAKEAPSLRRPRHLGLPAPPARRRRPPPGAQGRRGARGRLYPPAGLKSDAAKILREFSQPVFGVELFQGGEVGGVGVFGGVFAVHEVEEVLGEDGADGVDGGRGGSRPSHEAFEGAADGHFVAHRSLGFDGGVDDVVDVGVGELDAGTDVDWRTR